MSGLRKSEGSGLRKLAASDARRSSYQSAAGPAILTVSKALDALGIHPLLWGWDGLATSDATSYLQQSLDACTAGSKGSDANNALLVPAAKALLIPGRARVTAPIVVKNRAVDRVTKRLSIMGINEGAIEIDGDFEAFTSEDADIVALPSGKLSPCSEGLRFRDLLFINKNFSNNCSLLSSKWTRVWFEGCDFWAVPALNSDRFAQEFFFESCVVKCIPENRAFFKSIGAYLIQATLFKAQFSTATSKGCFLLRDEVNAVDQLTGVVGCSFAQIAYESSFGPFLTAGSCQGVEVSSIYTENNSTSILDFRCRLGATNKGVDVAAGEFNANNVNAADPNFYHILWGPGGGSSAADSYRGNLHRNARAVDDVAGLKLDVGCGVFELHSDDRPAGPYKKYESNLDGQIDLIPDPTSLFASKIRARTVVVFPTNGVQAHTVALPPPVAGPDSRVKVINRLTGATQSFTVRPSWQLDGSKFRGGAADGGLPHEPGVAKDYICLEGGIWDVAA